MIAEHDFNTFFGQVLGQSRKSHMVVTGETVFCIIGKISRIAYGNVGGVKINKISLLDTFAGFFEITATDVHIGFLQILTYIDKILLIEGCTGYPVVVRDIEETFAPEVLEKLVDWLSKLK